MTKKLGVLITVLCMSGGVAYAQSPEMLPDEGEEVDPLAIQGEPKPIPDYVEVNNDNPVSVAGLCEFIWNQEMTPMPVTVMFADGTTSEAMWGGAVGAVSADGWSLVIEPGNTWGRAWTLTTSQPIKALWINALAGKVDTNGDGKPDIATVFDIRQGPAITDGSASGMPFTTVEGIGKPARNTVVDPEPTLTATYEKPVLVKGNPNPVPDTHDLYAELHIDFDEPFIGSTEIPGPLFFRADTDCVLKVKGSITPTKDGISVHAIGDEGDIAFLAKDGEILHEVTFGPDCSVCENAGVGQYRVEADLTVGPGEYTLEAVTADSGWTLVHSLSKK